MDKGSVKHLGTYTQLQSKRNAGDDAASGSILTMVGPHPVTESAKQGRDDDVSEEQKEEDEEGELQESNKRVLKRDRSDFPVLIHFPPESYVFYAKQMGIHVAVICISILLLNVGGRFAVQGYLKCEHSLLGSPHVQSLS